MSLSDEPNNPKAMDEPTSTPLTPTASLTPTPQNKKSGIVKGILLGIGITLMVGLGTCAFILNPPNFGASSVDKEHQQRQANGLKTLAQKATAPNADGKSLWTYAQVLQNTELRQQLHLPQTAEQSEQLALQYLTKSAEMGQKEAILDLGNQLLEQSLSKSADGSLIYPNAKLIDAKKLDTALNWYIKAYQQGCEFMRLDKNDSQSLLNNLADYDNLPIGWSLDSSIVTLLDNPAMPNQPELNNKISVLSLKANKFCISDRQSLQRELIEHLITTDELSLNERQQDYVVAKLIDEADINYLQHKKIPPVNIATFDKQTQALYDSYIKIFGKPTFDSVAPSADTTSITASTASVAQ